jgi:hypothetical protein
MEAGTCLDNRLTDGGEVVSLTRRQPLTQRKMCNELEGNRSRSESIWLDGLGKTTKIASISGIRV